LETCSTLVGEVAGMTTEIILEAQGEMRSEDRYEFGLR
jgi:hypothetical protein